MSAKWDVAAVAEGSGTEPPAWIEKFLEGCPAGERFEVDRFTTGTVRDRGDMALVTVRVGGADELDPLSFQRQTVAAYRAAASALSHRPARHPIRFWNFIPDINKPISESLSRYMVFNAGRFAAFHEWYGDSKPFDRQLATASGVGHAGSDLVIHCLSAAAPGKPIENPRQVSSYHYSVQHGPLPPTFARATAITLNSFDGSWLLVGGTASIRGECSMHLGDLIEQTNETLRNLAALVRAGSAPVNADQFHRQTSDVEWLSRFRWLRIYHVRLLDRPVIARILAAEWPDIEHIEWRQANLCRPELLVEIEGVAHQPGIDSAPSMAISPARQRAALEV